ncbi:uncharacterized protein J4E78_009197 [Alternaria triticimaculans]|uniref:uncharacterized protein n=1 Tax=Alternaria triticimaculans TaxID=297637 RepID=UPI0020C36EB3|nr:uncharacterized protein J4E78_009197 [Alternaria triticimaculans]KAI4646276.1 hypothetical protein J4E78_009197 [Alternaria triticimaculans]
MDRYQQYATRVKSEDDELGIWVPVNQEPAEIVPAVVPKLEPTDKELLASLKKQRKKARKEQKNEQASKGQRRGNDQVDLKKQNARLRKELADARSTRPHGAQSHRIFDLEEKFFRACKERDEAVAQRNVTATQRQEQVLTRTISDIKIQNSRLRQDLSGAQKKIASLTAGERASYPDNQDSPPHQESEPTVNIKGASTITALRAEISELEKQLKDALRNAENAERDARAFKKNNVDAEALDKQLAVERAKNRALVSKLQKALKKEQDKSEEAHTGSREVNDMEIGMAGWPGSRGLPTRQQVKVEDEDMELEDGE